MQETSLCPVCGDRWPVYLLPDHCAAHFVDDASGDMEVGMAERMTTGEGGQCSNSSTLAEQAVLALAAREQEEFERLQASFGFSDKRKGKCFRCKREGHWARDCPQNPTVHRQQQRVVAAEPEILLKAQQPARVFRMQPDVITLLQQCLEAQPKPMGYKAFLSGPFDHYQSESSDSGWGCGWRNIQMQLSFIAHNRPEMRQSMFGGNAFVPDIASLQGWLECAWKAGFDPPGAEQLGHTVQGGRKWIGTTECAALLRYWGVRAQIIDFQSESAGQQGAEGGGGRSKDGLEIHYGVECNGCGQSPMQGPCYRSQVVKDFDLCKNCHDGSAHSVLAPFEKVMKGTSPSWPAHAAESYQKFHQQLASWVWRYYGEGSVPAPASSAGRAESLVCPTGKPPLYFQHAGHSRTVVGIERKQVKGQLEYSLLVLDPGADSRAMYNALASKAKWQYMIKRGVHTLRKAEYQLLYMEDGIATGSERDNLKSIQRVTLLKY